MFKESKAQEFYSKFIKALKKANESDFELYENRTSWTMYISKRKDSLMNHVLEEIFDGCETSNEYYNIDNITWMQFKDRLVDEAFENKSEKRIDRVCWQMIAAVEHENEQGKWTDELAKLFNVKAQLKVVIGYSDSSNRHERECRAATEIIRTLKMISKEVDVQEEYLLIFGKSSNQIDKNNLKASVIEGYKAYIWDNNLYKFVQFIV